MSRGKNIDTVCDGSVYELLGVLKIELVIREVANCENCEGK